MRLPVPLSVLEQYAFGVKEGRWEGWGIWLDVVGFSSFTEELERTSGPRGLERLVGHLREAYGQIFPRIRFRGGEIVQFTGDGLLAWFETAGKGEVQDLLLEILAETSPLSFRGAIIRGPLRWKIVEHHRHALYVIFGEAFLPDHWIRVSRKDRMFRRRTPAPEDSGSPGPLPAENRDMVSKFLPSSVLSEDEGMFRDVAVVFLLLNRPPLHDPEGDARTLLSLATDRGGWIARMGFSEKGMEALVLFGAPRAREGLIHRARMFASSVREVFGDDVRGGLAYGQVFAGWVGGERGEYTVMGRAVNRAAHLAKDAAWGAFGEEIPVGEGEEAEEGPPIPFVGREDAFEILGRMLEKLREGSPGLALITGPPGIGKTRFLEEAIRRLWPERSVLVRADPGLPPVEPVYALFEGLVGARPTEPGFAESVKGWIASGSRNPSLASRALELLDPAVREAMGLPRWLAALLEFLLQLSAEEGILVVGVDDIPWLDHTSREVFRKLLSRKVPFAIWATAPGRMSMPFPVQPVEIRLRPLSEREIRRFVSAVLGGPPDARLFDFLRDRSEGNPLFLEQLLQFLRARGHITRDRGFWTLRKEAFSHPLRIREVVLARFDQMGERVREFLFLAAVAGNRFHLGWFKRVFPEEEIRSILREAVGAGFVRVQESWASFSHAMIRDVLYAVQTSGARAKRHLAVARALEESGERVLGALHRFRAWRLGGGDEEEVRQHVKEALEHARDTHDPERRLELLEALETVEIPPEERVALYLEKGKIFVEMGRWRQAEETFASAEALARRLGIPSKVVESLKERAFLRMLRGQSREALEFLREARGMAESSGDHEGLAAVWNIEGTVFWNQGEPEKALRAFEQSREHAERAGRQDLVIRSLNNIANVLDDMGLHQRAEAFYREYLEYARTATNHLREAAGLFNLGGNLLLQERYHEAIDLLERAASAFRTRGHLRGIASALHNLSMALLELGDLETARRRALQAQRAYRVLGYPKGLAMIHAVTAEIFRRSGDFPRARGHVRVALRHARRGPVPYAEGEAFLVLAEILRNENRWRDVLRAATRVQAIGDRLQHPRFQFASRALALETRIHLGSSAGLVDGLRELEHFARTPGDRAWFQALCFWITGDLRARSEAERTLRELYARTGRFLYRERLTRLRQLIPPSTR